MTREEGGIRSSQASALWAALGVGIGAIVRDRLAAIVGLFAWVFVVEILLFQYLPAVARYAPGAAGTAMTGDTVGDSSIHLLSELAGGRGQIGAGFPQPERVRTRMLPPGALPKIRG